MDKINLLVDGETKVVEIRQGEALPLQEPKSLLITGYIDSIYNFLSVRQDTIEQKKCHIIVDKEGFAILLNIDECNHYTGKVQGQLKHTEIWKKFGINSGKEWTTHELADFIKMHRAFFEKPSDAAALVTDLRKFKAKVDQQIESSDDKRGNVNQLRHQIVDSNIPESFKVDIPIFKGQPAETLELEVYINADSFECSLISADAQERIHRTTDGIIDEQIDKIKEVCPEIVIIYQ